MCGFPTSSCYKSLSAVQARLGKVRSALQHSFWFLPALLSIFAAALSLLAGEVGRLVEVPSVGWVYSLGSQGIRDLLGMIAGSMITVATTAFSIIIVAQRLPTNAILRWEGSVDLNVENTGYIQAVDAKKLMNVAVAADIQVYLTKRPAQQDVAFVFDQLVEIGIRALSPGIYDSFTAMRCVDRLADALSLVARTPFPSPYRSDEEGRLRVITEPLNFAVLISLVLYPLAEAAAGHTNVVARLFGAIGEIGSACGEEREREALRRLNDYLLELSQTAPGRPVEYAGLDKLHEQANQIVGKAD